MPVIRLAVPNERLPSERRVAITPAVVAKLVAGGDKAGSGSGYEIWVEAGAGLAAGHRDDDYRAAGATVADFDAVVGSGGVVVTINGPRPDLDPGGGHQPWSVLTADHHLIGVLDPLWRPDDMAKLAATGATVLALDLMPRITRAQSMDVLSSMATVAGYEAALLAATESPKMLPLLMTAAGTVTAARVLVLGAGVAGLQAIATSRRLGAVVDGYDIRPAATEQIRSLGARAIDPEGPGDRAEDSGGYARRQSDDQSSAQHDLLAPYVAEADIVITTAAVPGARSPELITTTMVEAMEPGSVIVDLAAERGGNCAVTVADERVDHCGVTVLGPTDLASRSAATASHLFAGNLRAVLDHLRSEDGELVIDRDDEITDAILVARGGAVVHPRLTALLADGGDRAIDVDQPTTEEPTS